MQEFYFNVAFSNDNVGPGDANQPRFVGVASNNQGSTNPKDPLRTPQVIATTSGWHNFQHKLYASGGNLVCDLSVFPENCGTATATWTLPVLKNIATNTPLPVAEAGYPGSGYLTTLLMSDGHPNMAVAQQVFNTVL